MMVMVQDTLSPYVYLMGLDAGHIAEGLQTEPGCHRALWDFFSRLVYEKPRLREPDTEDGLSVQYLRGSFKCFFAEQVRFRTV